MLVKTGIPTEEQVRQVSPSQERLAAGPVAVIECFQEIPCNPCWEACAKGAILGMDDMNNIPKLNFDKCNGCGTCAMKCPGLAIFIIDSSYSPTEAVVRLPYEFYPLPEADEEVIGLNRAGEKLGKFRVIKVQKGGIHNKTALIWVAVPNQLAFELRNIQIERVVNVG